MLIIGLSGPKGVGKDFVAHNVIERILHHYESQLRIRYLSFAEIQKYRLHDLSTNASKIPIKDETIAQYRTWCSFVERNGCDILITTDVDSPNKARYIQKACAGLVFKVEAPDRCGVDSFSVFHGFRFDGVINNSNNWYSGKSNAEIEEQYRNCLDLIFETAHCMGL
jgi:hypothetical protein